MMIEELIKNLKEQAHVIRKYDIEQCSEQDALALDQIITILRAGQAMRGKFTIRYDSGDESHVATKVDYLGLGEAGQAWDAAVSANEISKGDDE